MESILYKSHFKSVQETNGKILCFQTKDNWSHSQNISAQKPNVNWNSKVKQKLRQNYSFKTDNFITTTNIIQLFLINI